MLESNTAKQHHATPQSPARKPKEQAGRLHLEYPTKTNLLVGDARQLLKTLPDETFRCCVTSPPYWGLRDYGVGEQIGAEMKVEDFITDLVAVFREVRRTLRKDGTFWLNIGDSYTSGGRTWRDADAKNQGRVRIPHFLYVEKMSQHTVVWEK